MQNFEKNIKIKNFTEWSLKRACHSAAIIELSAHWMPEIRISVNVPRAFWLKVSILWSFLERYMWSLIFYV